MKNLIDLLSDIYHNGHDVSDRTGVGRRKVFGRQLRFNMSGGFPLLTTNKTPIKTIINELLWFIHGGSSVNELNSVGVKIWDQWAVREPNIRSFVEARMADSPVEEKEGLIAAMMEHSEGEIGPIYGTAWREAPRHFYNISYPIIKPSEIAPDRLQRANVAWESMKDQLAEKNVSYETFLQTIEYQSIDQLQQLLNGLKKRPYSSRHIISTWIPENIPFEEMSPQDNVIIGLGALAPCHVLQQYLVLPPRVEGGKPRLSLQMYQRSLDTAVGGPFNVAQYSLLLMMIAQVVDMEADEFIWTIGDAHIYLDQKELVAEHLKRVPATLPKMKIDPSIKNLFDFRLEHFELTDYNPHPVKLQYPVAT